MAAWRRANSQQSRVSCKASSIAPSDKSNHCCEKRMRAVLLTANAGGGRLCGTCAHRCQWLHQTPKLRPNHREFLDRAMQTSTGKSRSTSNFAQYHNPALFEYAQQVMAGEATDESAPPHDFDAMVQQAMLDTADRRAARLAISNPIPEQIRVMTTAYRRNHDVVAEVLLRAAGSCEICNNTAPFLRAVDGLPYLEVHHSIPLAAGGHDTVENAVAACPNCHRQAHFG